MMTDVWQKPVEDRYRYIKQDDAEKTTIKGDVFQRYEGLDKVLSACKGASVLDIGSYKGMIAYKCCEHGARHIDGMDVFQKGVHFSQELFEDIYVPSRFYLYDLATGPKEFTHFSSQNLLPAYDIVLFLAVYQHLAFQMPAEALRLLTQQIIKLCKGYFVFRSASPVTEEISHLCEAEGLVRDHQTAKGHIKPVTVYRLPSRTGLTEQAEYGRITK